MANYSFIPPVDRHIRVSSFYGNRKNPFGVGISTHNGIDFACPMGSNVYASADGKVLFIGLSVLTIQMAYPLTIFDIASN